MSKTFSREEIEEIAKLAHVRLDDGELELYARQLTAILGYAEQVQRFDTTGIAPTSGVLQRQGVDRPDTLHTSLDRASALGNAPDASMDAGLFKVPRVIG